MSKIILTTEEDLAALIRSILSEFMPKPDEMEKREVANRTMLNADQAADLLSIAKQTLYGKTMKNEIPFYKVGKRLYFDKEELIQFIKGNRKGAMKEKVEDYESKRKNRRTSR